LRFKRIKVDRVLVKDEVKVVAAPVTKVQCGRCAAGEVESVREVRRYQPPGAGHRRRERVTHFSGEPCSRVARQRA